MSEESEGPLQGFKKALKKISNFTFFQNFVTINLGLDPEWIRNQQQDPDSEKHLDPDSVNRMRNTSFVKRTTLREELLSIKRLYYLVPWLAQRTANFVSYTACQTWWLQGPYKYCTGCEYHLKGKVV
jgi:hypothetical protein